MQQDEKVERKHFKFTHKMPSEQDFQCKDVRISDSKIVKSLRKLNDCLQSNIQFEIRNLISQNIVTSDKPNAIANLIQFVFSSQYIYDNQQWKQAVLKSQVSGQKGYIHIRQVLNLRPIVDFINKYTIQEPQSKKMQIKRPCQYIHCQIDSEITQKDLQLILRKVQQNSKKLRASKNSIRKIVPFIDKTKEVVPIYVQGYSGKVPCFQLHNFFSSIVQVYKINFSSFQYTILHCSDPQKIFELNNQPVFKQLNQKYSEINTSVNPNNQNNRSFSHLEQSGKLRVFQFNQIQKSSDPYKKDKSYRALQQIYDTKKPYFMNCFKDDIYLILEKNKESQFIQIQSIQYRDVEYVEYDEQQYEDKQYFSRKGRRQKDNQRQNGIQKMQQEKFQQININEYSSDQQFYLFDIKITNISNENKKKQENFLNYYKNCPVKKPKPQKPLTRMLNSQTEQFQNNIIKPCQDQAMLLLLYKALNPLKSYGINKMN